MKLQIPKQELLIVSVTRQIEKGDRLLLGVGMPFIAGAVAQKTPAPDAPSYAFGPRRVYYYT